MLKRALKHFRERIRQRQYVMTLHAEEEMEEDGLSVSDVECAILMGEIVESQELGKNRATTRGERQNCLSHAPSRALSRLSGDFFTASQRDRMTGERKCRVRGEAVAGEEVEVIAKVGATGKVVVITVYRV